MENTVKTVKQNTKPGGRRIKNKYKIAEKVFQEWVDEEKGVGLSLSEWVARKLEPGDQK